MKSVAVMLDGGYVQKRLYSMLGKRHPEASDVIGAPHLGGPGVRMHPRPSARQHTIGSARTRRIGSSAKVAVAGRQSSSSRAARALAVESGPCSG